jgi:hypothetical protein
MFAAMPIAGLLAAAHRFGSGSAILARQRALRRASGVAALVGLLQLAVSIPSLFPDSAVASWPAVTALYAVRGLAERTLFIALLVVLLRIAAVISHGSTTWMRSTTRDGGQQGLHPSTRPSRRRSAQQSRGSYAAGTATRIANMLASRAAERADSSKSGARQAKRVRPSAPPRAHA